VVGRGTGPGRRSANPRACCRRRTSAPQVPAAVGVPGAEGVACPAIRPGSPEKGRRGCGGRSGIEHGREQVHGPSLALLLLLRSAHGLAIRVLFELGQKCGYRLLHAQFWMSPPDDCAVNLPDAGTVGRDGNCELASGVRSSIPMTDSAFARYPWRPRPGALHRAAVGTEHGSLPAWALPLAAWQSGNGAMQARPTRLRPVAREPRAAAARRP
jgi:hypothetical protein